MSNLVPDPGDRSDGQLTPIDNNSPDLYFQDLIAQQQNSLTPTTDLEEYKKRLEIIQMALDLSEKRTDIDRKATQDAINIEIARIELSDRKIRSNEVNRCWNLYLVCVRLNFRICAFVFRLTTGSI
jgi:hypothetical protein